MLKEVSPCPKPYQSTLRLSIVLASNVQTCDFLVVPLFTAETAKANALKSAQVRRDNAELRREQEQRILNAATILQATPHMVGDAAVLARVHKQLSQCDEMIDQCTDPDTFVKLTAAKERLWNLVLPKAGSRRPGRSESRRAPPVAMEAPAEEQPKTPAQNPPSTQ